MLGGGGGGWWNRIANQSHFGEAKYIYKKLKMVVNIMTKIVVNTQDRYPIVISTLWHC